VNLVLGLYNLIIIIIIISPQRIKRMNADELGDLECLNKACQTATTVGGLFTNPGINECGADE